MEMVPNLVAAGAATAVLVDGENIPHAMAVQIIAKTRHCPPIVQRVYGDLTRLYNWEKAVGFEGVHTGCAKNAADMRIVMDALDLVHRGGVGRVVIASSDRDFTQLAQYLRARRTEVFGMGSTKTHESFRKACSVFAELVADEVRPVIKAKIAPIMNQVDAQIVAIIMAQGKEGILVQQLSVMMTRAHQFGITSTGQKSWRAYLSSKSEQYNISAEGTQIRVRLK